MIGDSPKTLTFYLPPPQPTADEIIAGIPQESCPRCGADLRVMAFKLEDGEIIRRLVEVTRQGDGLRFHTHDPCDPEEAS